MLHMISTATPARRVVLVPAEPRSGRGDGAVRRYRLARVRLEGRDLPRAERRADQRRFRLSFSFGFFGLQAR